MVKKYIVYRNSTVEVQNKNIPQAQYLETIINFKTDMEIINYLKSILELTIGYGQDIGAVEGIILNNKELKQVNIQINRNGKYETDVLRRKQIKPKIYRQKEYVC